MGRFLGALGVAMLLCSLPGRSQVIAFESNGLKYQTLTKSGVTVIFATLPSRLHAYAIFQVSIANGSPGPYMIRPEDFTFDRGGGAALRGSAASEVIRHLVQRSSSGDVLKLVSAYEASLYGVPNMRSTNGYEQRREAALLFGPARLRAAAAASAVALVQTKIGPGQSTDGAVFFPTDGKPLGPGRLIVRTNTDTFEFNPE
ncbi:MAG: hypothetical protein ABSC23_05220 [Bryobacteraceae bacterium]